jgi:hypothetical protein
MPDGTAETVIYLFNTKFVKVSTPPHIWKILPTHGEVQSEFEKVALTVNCDKLFVQ